MEPADRDVSESSPDESCPDEASEQAVASSLLPEGNGDRVIRSEDLLQGQRRLVIIHGGQVYRLFRTRNNKLILQK